MLKKFLSSNNGDVVGKIIILAIILAASYKFFNFIKLSSASQTEDTAVGGVSYVLEWEKKKPSGSSSGGTIAINDEKEQINHVMESPKIELDPESKEYFYSYNDMLKVKATPVEGNAYKPKEPVACKWEGIEGYSGTSCQPEKEAKLKVGENVIKVTMCDARKACSKSERKIHLGYKDPMLIMHEEWDNYIVSGNSGEWKYDEKTNTIYSTKNVHWSGYWNPKDSELTDYDISFKMMVSSPDTDDDSIGFTFRQTNSQNYYFLSLDNRSSNGGAIHSGLYKTVNGKRTLLVDLMPRKWERNVWTGVRIKVMGSHIQVWLDGVQVASVYDYSHSKGGYGPFSYSQAYARYKDLKINFD